ncbi:hypothetical protein IWZ01DRAFT_484617 [Phyllosticta capitalensis]
MEIHGLHETYLFLLLVADHGHREEKTTIGHSILPPQPVVIAQSCGHKERQTLTQPMAKSSIISRCLLSPNLRALDPSTHSDDINAKWHPSSTRLDEQLRQAIRLDGRRLEMAQPTNPDGYMRADDYPLLRRQQPRLAQAAAALAGWLAEKGKWRWERTNRRQVQIVGRAPRVKPHENGGSCLRWPKHFVPVSCTWSAKFRAQACAGSQPASQKAFSPSSAISTSLSLLSLLAD